ncbi:MAG: MBL fold metallo-hydrolase [Armatimonadota bacterium]|nr:MBL fold metallo-hydrolase [Armatimonadota bacterium]MDR7451164.1 MBL fold metallo-hydrolase [Armatimonadota bacterium]MDR7467231.1 MBL fold metallo-hydrolase [Armatimonadota bacterium]MDR7494841.1 MBL fold metallo-hydrolase [Armatimonadota bacterium]MDR7500266.1 MBL fold metallo-hydrolase [Armatimonadota bacterium]
MKLTYYGHASFLLESDGTSILIDPFNEKCGYPFPKVSPTAVVVSHEHFDHNYVQVAGGSPRVIRGLRADGQEWADVRERVGPVALTTVKTYHDTAQGKERGRNAIFIFEAEGLRLVHAGDLGHTLSPDQVKAVGRPDLLLIPVGGYYTIGPAEATAVVDQLRPRVVVPMHYKTEVNKDWPIGPVDDFLRGKSGIRRLGHTVTVSPATLPEGQEIWVLSHA